MRSFHRRPAALGLLLLLQVFVLSGYIHACCLSGGHMGHGGGEHGGHGVDAAVPMEMEGAAHASSPHADGHAADHVGHDAHSAHGGHGDAHAGHSEAASAPAGDTGHDHSAPADPCGNCGDACDFCCQTASGSALAGTVGSDALQSNPDLTLRSIRSVRVELPAAPAFFLPFANGPPAVV